MLKIKKKKVTVKSGLITYVIEKEVKAVYDVVEQEK